MRRKSRFVLVLCVCMAYMSCVNVLADVNSADIKLSAEFLTIRDIRIL